jgi:hypothetical protein
MSPAAPVDWALAYARHSLAVFPVKADKTPLTPNGFKDASTDPAVIEDWWWRWPHADPAWALPATVVVINIDIKNGKNGYHDFKRLSGCDPLNVDTPTTSTPSGGMQLFFAAAKTYRKGVAIEGTGIDTRSKGGYVVLPGPNNGRQWLKPPRSPMAEAPAWLDCAPKEPAAPVLFGRPRGRRQARAALDRACTKSSRLRTGSRTIPGTGNVSASAR